MAVAVLSLPLVWTFQFTGGARAQWGGRYVLTTGVLLVAVGVARSGELVPWVRRFVIVLSALATAFGAVWVVQRSHQIAEGGAAIAARSEPVVISTFGFLLREYGAFYDGQRWLTVVEDDDLPDAVAVVRQAGFDEFALVRTDPTEPTPTI